MAKEYLSRKGIAYTEYDVAKDPAKARELMQKSGAMVVPVITVDSDVVIGFDRAKLDALLSNQPEG